MASNTATLQIRVQVDASGAVKVLEGVKSSSQKAGDAGKRSFDKMGASAKSLESMLIKVGAAFGAFQVAKGFIATAASFEKLEISLTTLQGSSSKAKESVAWIAEFTKKTPYELLEVSSAFQKLTAYGMDATKYIGMLGDTASGMGKDLNMAVEMFADAATGEFERLKEFGVKAKTEGDIVTFAWSQNGKDMTLSAQKTQSGISTALEQIFQRFKGGMDAQSRSWDGLMSNLKDNWTMFEKAVMDAGVFDALKTELEKVTKASAAWLEENDELIKQKVPEYIDNIKTALSGIPGTVQSTITELKNFKSEFQWVIDNWEIIGGLYLGFSKGGLKGALIGGSIGLVVDKYRDLKEEMEGAAKAAENVAKVEARLAKENGATGSGVLGSGGYSNLVTVVDNVAVKTRLAKEETNKLADAVTKAGPVVTALTKEQKAAEKAAQKHADQIRNVIDNLQWELSIVKLSEEEQSALNAVRSEGVTLASNQGQAIYNLTKELAAERDMIAYNREELARLAEEYAANDYEGVDATAAWNDNLIKIWKTELYGPVEDEYKKWWDSLDGITQKALENIHDSIAGFFAKAFRGELSSSKDIFKELMYTMSDSAAQDFATQFRKINWDDVLGNLSGDLGEFFTNILDDFGLTAGQAVNSLAAVIATAYSAVGMAKKDAALSGAMTGASVGGQTGGGYGAAIGAVLGGAGGWLLGSNGPSTGERLADAIEKLIETLQENTTMMADQILKTDELTLAQDNMIRSIFSTKMDGMEAMLAQTFKIPEGMKRRSNGGMDYLEEFSRDFASGMSSSYWKTLDASLHLESPQMLKNKGYTSYDYDRSETSDIISDLIEKIGVPDFITLMAETAKDGGALIAKLVETGYILADMPERVLKHYSDGGSSKLARNEKVAEAIFTVLVDGIMETAAAIDQMNVASDAFAKTWRDKDLTAKASDVQSWEETMNVFGGDAMQDYLAQVAATRDALLNTSTEALEKMDASELADHFKNIAALDKVLTDSTGKLAEAEETRLLIEQHYYDALVETTAAMAKDIAIATGTMSGMEQAFLGIRETGEKYIDQLIDEGMNKDIATAKGENYIKTLQKEAFQKQFNADQTSIESAILQERINLLTTLGKTEEAQTLNQQMINKNRQIEVQGLIDTYGYGTDAFKALFNFRKELWGVQDAARNAATAMAGMWNQDSLKKVKEGWISVIESLGETVTPKFFLDALGLGRDSGLEHLLTATTADEVKVDYMELKELWRTGVINQEQFDAIMSEIISNGSDVAQATADAAQQMEEAAEAMRVANQNARDWRKGMLNQYSTAPENEMENAFKDVDSAMDDLRDAVLDAGKTVSDMWKVGGPIETEVKNQIRAWYMDNLRTDIDTSLSSQGKTALEASLADISDTVDKWITGLESASLPADEITKRISDIEKQKDADIKGVYANTDSWLKDIEVLNGPDVSMRESDRLILIEQYTKAYNDALAKQGDQIDAITKAAESSILALQKLGYTEEDLAKIRQWEAAEIQKLKDDYRQPLTEIVATSGMSDLEKQIYDLNAWYAEQAIKAEALGESLDLLNQAYDAQAEKIAEARVEDARADYMSAISRKIDELQEAQQAIEDEYNRQKDAYVTRLQELIDAENEANQKQIDAKNDLLDAARNLAEGFGAVVDRIKQYRDDLLTSDSLIGIETRYKTSRSQLDAAIRDMYSSDKNVAFEAMEKIPDLSQTFLDLSKGVNSNAAGYNNDLAKVLAVLNTTEAMAGNYKTVEERTVSALESQVDILTEHTSMYQQMLDEIENAGKDTRTLAEIQGAYYASKTAFDESTLATEINYWQAELDKMDALANTMLSIEASLAVYNQALLDLAMFNAGIVTVPAGGMADDPLIADVVTGYSPAPVTTNSQDMKDVAAVLSEVKGVLIQIRDTNGDINLNGKKLQRILDRVTQGETTIRIKAVA